MLKQCKECNLATGTVHELRQLVENGDAPKVLHALTDMVVHEKNLHHDDRCALASVMHLLTTAMQEQIEERQRAAG